MEQIHFGKRANSVLRNEKKNNKNPHVNKSILSNYMKIFSNALVL